MNLLLCLSFIIIFLSTSHVTISVQALSSTSRPPKIALVTGANKGIGLEIAKKLGSEKDEDQTNEFVCILGCRNEVLGKKAMNELKSRGIDVDFVHIDLEDTNSINLAAKYIGEKYGRCDVLINNAAVCFNDPTLYGKVESTPFDKQADITIRTNFFGTLSLTKSMIPLLQKSDSPRIINIASSAGRLSILPAQERRDAFASESLEVEDLETLMKDFVKAAQGGTHQKEGWPNTGYGVSKVGIISLTKILARQHTKFMINSVDPGYCKTDQNNNQGYIPAERGAVTPYLLATLKDEDQHISGLHWFQEQEIEW